MKGVTKPFFFFSSPILTIGLGHDRKQDPPKCISFVILQTSQTLSDFISRILLYLYTHSILILKQSSKYTEGMSHVSL